VVQVDLRLTDQQREAIELEAMSETAQTREQRDTEKREKEDVERQRREMAEAERVSTTTNETEKERVIDLTLTLPCTDEPRTLSKASNAVNASDVEWSISNSPRSTPRQAKEKDDPKAEHPFHNNEKAVAIRSHARLPGTSEKEVGERLQARELQLVRRGGKIEVRAAKAGARDGFAPPANGTSEDSEIRCATSSNYEKHETHEKVGGRPSIFRAFRVFRSSSAVVDALGFGDTSV
jgi:hypothetical protein